MKTLKTAVPGDVFRHEASGMEVEVMWTLPQELFIRSLTNVKGFTFGLEARLEYHAKGWHFVRPGYVI